MKITDLSHDPLALTILALLAEKPQHPYALQRLMRERKKDFAHSTPRTLYHSIDRLVKANLILPAATQREGNRPERTVYQIADEGREALLSWLGELLAQPTPDYPLFTRRYVFPRASACGDCCSGAPDARGGTGERSGGARCALARTQPPPASPAAPGGRVHPGVALCRTHVGAIARRGYSSRSSDLGMPRRCGNIPKH